MVRLDSEDQSELNDAALARTREANLLLVVVVVRQ